MFPRILWLKDNLKRHIYSRWAYLQWSYRVLAIWSDEEFISSSQNPVSYLLHALGFKKEQKTIAFEQAYIQNGDYIIGVGVRSFNAVQDIENDVLKKICIKYWIP